MSWLKGRLVAEEVGAAWGAKRWETISGGQIKLMEVLSVWGGVGSSGIKLSNIKYGVL